MGRRWGWIVVVVLAAGPVGWVAWFCLPTGPPAPEPPATTAVPALAELAAFEPPPYTPVRLRGSADVAGERFLRAMEPYAKGDYRAALVGLAAAAELDPRAPHAVFFLGACYLLTDQPDAAIRAFQRAIALGDSPYLEGAHFYLAKALLRKGELAAAAAELHKTVHRKGELESRAQELLAQVERLSNAPR